MNLNRSSTAIGAINPSSEKLIQNAFDRLYERSPLPQLVSSERIDQMYKCLAKPRNPNSSFSHSDHSASIGDNSFSHDVDHGSRPLDRSSDSVFRSPVQPHIGRNTSSRREVPRTGLPKQDRNTNSVIPGRFGMAEQREFERNGENVYYNDNMDSERSHRVDNRQVLYRGDKFNVDDMSDNESIQEHLHSLQPQRGRERNGMVKGPSRQNRDREDELTSDQEQWLPFRTIDAADAINSRPDNGRPDNSRPDVLSGWRSHWADTNDRQHMYNEQYLREHDLRSPVMPFQGVRQEFPSTRGERQEFPLTQGAWQNLASARNHQPQQFWPTRSSEPQQIPVGRLPAGQQGFISGRSSDPQVLSHTSSDRAVHRGQTNARVLSPSKAFNRIEDTTCIRKRIRPETTCTADVGHGQRSDVALGHEEAVGVAPGYHERVDVSPSYEDEADNASDEVATCYEEDVDVTLGYEEDEFIARGYREDVNVDPSNNEEVDVAPGYKDKVSGLVAPGSEEDVDVAPGYEKANVNDDLSSNSQDEDIDLLSDGTEDEAEGVDEAEEHPGPHPEEISQSVTTLEAGDGVTEGNEDKEKSMDVSKLEEDGATDKNVEDESEAEGQTTVQEAGDGVTEGKEDEEKSMDVSKLEEDGATDKNVEDESEAEGQTTVQDADNEKSEGRTLYEWIIKPVKVLRGVCVEGKQSESTNEEFWKSSVIKERINATTIQTASGTVYHLVGKIDTLFALDEGFSKKFVKSFTRGFPRQWQQLIEDHFHAIDRRGQAKQEESKPAKKKTTRKPEIPTETFSPVDRRNTQEKENIRQKVCTPEGRYVDVGTLQKTRSGRMVKPPLFWWMGQRFETDGDNVAVSTATPYAQNCIEGIFQCLSSRKNQRDTSSVHNRSYNMKRKKLNKFRNKTMDNAVEIGSSARGNNVNVLPRDDSNTKRRSTRNRTLANIQENPLKNTSEELSLDNGGKVKSNKFQPKVVLRDVSVAESDGVSRGSDRENLNLEKNIEKALQVSRMNRQKPKARKKCYDGRGSVEVCAEGSSQGSDVYAFSSDGEERVVKTRNMPKQKDTKKNPEKSAECIPQDPEYQTEGTNTSQRTRTNPSREITRSPTHEGAGPRLRSRGQKASSISYQERDDSEEKTSRNFRSKSKNCAKCILDYSSSEEYKPQITRSQKNSRTRSRYKSKKSLENVEDSAEGSLRQEEGLVTSRPVEAECHGERPWSSGEVKRLRQAVISVRADDPDFWELVQSKVNTRTTEECQEYHWRDITAGKKKGQRKGSKADKSANSVADKVELTARVGTMKRKQQLRDLMEQQNDGYEDNLCDATPFRTRAKTKVPRVECDSDGDDLFDELARKNPHIVNRIHTPVMHVHIEPVSEKKTPINPLISPNEPVNRKEVDRYIHRFMKRRRLAHRPHRNKDNFKTPVNKPKSKYSKDKVPTPTKNLFNVTSGSVSSLLTEEKSDSDNYANSDEGSDYYWSDMDQ